MADLTITCATPGCGHDNTITAPESDADWDPIHEVDRSVPGRVYSRVGRRLVIRCTVCGERTEHVEDVVV